MGKVTGIKSVDFKIKALGHGVVNWNGPTNLAQEDGSTVDNHTLPKLRGYSNLTDRKKEGTGYKYRKEPTDIDFNKTPLYISQNCIRHHLFRDQAFDLHYAKGKDLTPLLASVMGLVRGYALPEIGQLKRTTPLLIEDFVDQLGNGNFEQMGRSGTKSDKEDAKEEDGKKIKAKKSNSFFSKTTFGDTEYLSYGSISIEQLQFISLDKKFDRAAMVITDAKGDLVEGTGEGVANAVQTFIQSLNPNLNPQATFHANYVRKGTIFEEGEAGILLNNEAIQALVEYTLAMISELTIRQAKSYMYVDEILVDYNDSSKMMRVKRDEGSISVQPESAYATYFYEK
jgi:hypothetical protein